MYRIAASSRIFSPVTMGLRRKLLLLPVTMVDVLPELDLHTVIAHEFAHMQRKDFMKNLLYELLSLPVSLPSAALAYSRAHHGKPRNRLRPDGGGNDRTK